MNSDAPKEPIIIPEEYAGQRLDKVLGALCENVSRGQLQKYIQNGDVSLNGRVITDVKHKVGAGDSVQVPHKKTDTSPQAEPIDLDIVYEDDDVLVINKQAGLVVHPGAGQKDGTLVNALLNRYGESFRGVGDPMRPGIVHRLDKDTTGVMCVAKSQKAYESLVRQLASREVSRVYHVLVWGRPHLIKDRIDKPIGRHKTRREKMIVSEEGQEAITDYHVIKSYGEAVSLLECRLHTGRTHQIRVHCQSIGFPVLGDRVYGAQPTKAQSLLKTYDLNKADHNAFLNFPRQALHAREITFTHPETGESQKSFAEYPIDFKEIIQKSERLL